MSEERRDLFAFVGDVMSDERMDLFAFVGDNGKVFSGESGQLDITGADDVEIKIREDGKVVWVDIDRCVLRICQIRGKVFIVDDRPKAEVVQLRKVRDGEE
jgi:hypothetical protein